MSNQKIIVFGANGQLGQCIQLAAKNRDYPMLFLNSKECDITNYTVLSAVFKTHQPAYIINAAAYTQVDLAEDERKKAFLVNATAVESIAKLCNLHRTKLIHISTDYVFDGSKKSAYLETDSPSPINTYGLSKLQGEKAIQHCTSNYYIIRTSWLYSQFGQNFYQSIIRKIGAKAPLQITTNQTGCPTNANDLAKVILKIINADKEQYGIYHFCNSGEATWYDLAFEIVKNEKALSSVQLSATKQYPQKAKRPSNSVLNTEKIKNTFGIKPKNWKTSLLELQKSTQ